jgi:hypothetical protein
MLLRPAAAAQWFCTILSPSTERVQTIGDDHGSPAASVFFV